MDIATQCPFCRGNITFQTHGEVPHATHSMPTCATYDRAEDALAFIVLVNNALGVKRS